MAPRKSLGSSAVGPIHSRPRRPVLQQSQQWAPEARSESQRVVKTRSCWKRGKVARTKQNASDLGESKGGGDLLGVLCRNKGRREMLIRSSNAQPRMSLPLGNFQGSLLATPESSSNSLARPSAVFMPRSTSATCGRPGISGLLASAQGLLCLERPLSPGMRTPHPLSDTFCF